MRWLSSLLAMALLMTNGPAACTSARLLTYNPDAPDFRGDPVQDIEQLSAQIQYLRRARPDFDADLALANGDTRFLAIADVSYTIPGIEGNDRTDLIRRRYGIAVIGGTKERVEGDWQTLQVEAIRYATIYNQQLVKKLKPFSKFTGPGNESWGR
jgi:hypothetical protein